MINFNRSIRTIFTKDLAGASLSNAEKMLLVTAVTAKGIVGDLMPIFTVKKGWSKLLFKIVFHQKYIIEAADEGWIDRSNRGYLSVTQEGIEHLESLLIQEDINPLSDKTELVVFSAKQTHDFDTMLRSILSSATTKVRIADSYVDETIFDTLLNVIPTAARVELMYNHVDNATIFHQRAKRFKVQYPNFFYGRYPKLHDRYVVVDSIGFVIGPSLKDAAVNSPAIIVRVGSDQSPKLMALFDNIFTHVTKIS